VIATFTRDQPSYGPHGEPYSVRARFADRIDLSHFWTEREALDARDSAFDDGARAVHVAGLPLRLAVVAPVTSRPRLIVED
jgi:hypothetical protein